MIYTIPAIATFTYSFYIPILYIIPVPSTITIPAPVLQ